MINTVANQPWPEGPGLFGVHFTGIGCTPGPAFQYSDDLPEPMRGVLLMPEVPMEHGSRGSIEGRMCLCPHQWRTGMQVGLSRSAPTVVHDKPVIDRSVY
ncbi:hypothetical protein E2F48_14200 [Arthrobacter crusticola]|uniref:Uncharacterized protein n=1 Tax=Arthrobacter crusticola TaxID=2547960 RepID=A0A4R5TNI6_9MICC|nr:hypothetical protein [Arthrobacter crusticola]TDK23943.1 hypothetical protein E2F48_14200 [Arthrobacter crusticola]